MRRRYLILFSFLIVSFSATFALKAADSGYFFKRGEDLLIQGDWDGAVVAFEKILQTDYKNTGAVYNLACALVSRGDYERGIENFRYALQLESSPHQKAFIFFNLGGAYYKLAALKQNKAFFRQAEKYFRQAEELLPKGFSLAADLADDASIHMKGIKRIGDISYIISEKSVVPDTVVLSQQAKKRNDWEEEESFFLIDKDSLPLLYFYCSPATYIIMANEYLSEENNFMAKQMLNAALDRLEPMRGTPLYKINNYIALEKLGFIFQEEDDFDKSTEYFQKALESGYGDDPFLHVELGNNYYKQKNYAKAKAEANRALKIVPDYQPARNLLNRITKGLP